MIDFWLPAGLLLLTALAFLLIPVLRIRKLQAEEDRTALNVTLYQERLQELETQRQAGV
ncbi:c-type cytochrome biogenesis protein CcmI, partial [Pseudomonas sp. EGD-AK9]